jgi:hypothetical protein
MIGQWELNRLSEPPQPHRIRPETHWFQETARTGRGDGGLWFSLEFRQARAEQFYQCLGELIADGARMAPTSHKALKYALKLEFNTVGTDIFVPKTAFDTLEKLSKEGAFKITDAGLAVEGEIKHCPEFQICFPNAEEPASSPMCGPIPPDSAVIIATIDDGIGIANHRFREAETTTRIKHFLDLALIGEPTANGWVDEPLGRSWKGDDIDKLLGRDEEQIYRALGLIDPVSQLRQPLRAAVTHGTHVLDLAAGYDWIKAEVEAAKARPIIAVQLPTQVGETRSDTWLPQSLKRALDWILVKADELSAELSLAREGNRRRLPLIVNGSFASMAGPQDGASDVERRITQFIKTYRGNGPEDLCTFVLSAGNSLQLRGQAQMDLPQRETKEIPWRVQPDGKTPSFVEIWLPKANNVGCVQEPQQVKVSLIPPGEDPDSALPSKLDAAVEWRVGGHPVARIYHQHFPRADGSRECITIAIRPTAADQEGDPVVPSGQWHIRIKNTGQRDLKNIDLRVHLNEVGMFSRSGARQSYFDDPRYEMFDEGSGRIINDERTDRPCGTRVTRQGTLSSYAYAEGVLAVGGYRLSDRQPATYSSSGRQANNPAPAGSSSASDLHYRTEGPDGNPLDGPDLAAVSEESPALTGVLAAGTYSGSVAILSGTSVAAPQITRALANQIAKCATGRKARVARPMVTPPRPLREGVGRLSFESSYPKRIGD